MKHTFDWSQERPWLAWMCIGTLASAKEVLCCPHELLERAVWTCREGSSDDRNGASELLFAYGKNSVEAGEWSGALWLKRLNEIVLHQEGISGVGRVAGFLQPHLDAAVTETLQARNCSLDRFREDALGVIRELFVGGQTDPAKSIPGLLMATQIRLSSLLESVDPLIVVQAALLEASMYADAGLTRDAEEAAQFAIGLLRNSNTTHELLGEAANSLIATADTCETHGDQQCARKFRQAAISLCDESHEEYAIATIRLAHTCMNDGDLREAYRLAQDAGRTEVAKDAVSQQLVEYFIGLLRVQLTGDLRHLVTEVQDVSDTLGGSPDAMRVFRMHFMKMMKGEKLTDDELLEGVQQFELCARHSESMGASEGAVTSFASAVKLLLSMDDFATHASFATELIANARAHVDAVTDELRMELDSLERILQKKCRDPEPHSPMQAPQGAFGLDSLRRRLLGGEPQ